MRGFRAYRVFQEDGKVQGRIVSMDLDELCQGDVVAKVAYSGVNYKDALAATGAGKVMRRFPLVGGIDFAGTVVSSGDPRFDAGDEVLVTGFGLGESHDGGFSEFVRVPADWVVPVPEGHPTERNEAPLFCLVPICLTATGCVALFFFSDALYALLYPMVMP